YTTARFVPAPVRRTDGSATRSPPPWLAPTAILRSIGGRSFARRPNARFSGRKGEPSLPDPRPSRRCGVLAPGRPLAGPRPLELLLNVSGAPQPALQGDPRRGGSRPTRPAPASPRAGERPRGAPPPDQSGGYPAKAGSNRFRADRGLP